MKHTNDPSYNQKEWLGAGDWCYTKQPMSNEQAKVTTLEEARDLIRRREKATLEILILAAPIMEAWAKSHELAEWHCRVESLIGTAYPAFYNHPILPDMNDNQ